MNQHQATDFIIRLLNQGRTHAEIVEEICAQTGWPAGQVEFFVSKVEAEVTAAPTSEPAGDAVEAPPDQPAPTQRPPGVEIEPSEELIQFVIAQLGRHHSRNDIVHRLCEQEGWPWRQAERFVRRVEIQHQDKIVARQSPVVILLGVGSLIVGAAIAIYTAVTLVGWISRPGVANPEQAESAAYYVVAFVTGLGMVIGGIAGVWRAMSLMRQ